MVLNAPLQCLKKCYESVIELHSFYVLPSSVKKTPKAKQTKDTNTHKKTQTNKKNKQSKTGIQIWNLDSV